MQLYGGKKSSRHSGGSGGEKKTPHGAENRETVERKAPAPEPKRRTPVKPAEQPREDRFVELEIDSGEDTLYSEEPRFESDEYISREERRSGRRWLRTVGIVLGVLAIVIVGGIVWFRSWVKPPDIVEGPAQHTPQRLEQETPAPTDDPGLDVEAVAPTSISEAGRRDGVYTFYIAGLDVEGSHTDTNIVGTFDTKAGKLNCVNIPRDTLVNVRLNIKKMNQVYPAAVNNGRDGVEAALDTVEDLLGYRVDCYAIIDIQAVAEVVDAIGGVWFDIPFDMDWDAPDQNPPVTIHIKQGYQLLDGKNFVDAMRFRVSNDGSHTYVRGDIERIEFQQQLLMALAKQLLTVGNIPNLGRIFDIYEEYVQTNVTVSNLAFFAQEFLKMSSDGITFQTIPNNPEGYLYGMNYVIPYIDEWLVMINEYLNPFTSEITENNLDMISWDGVNWRMTQGYIAGGEYSFHGAQA